MGQGEVSFSVRSESHTERSMKDTGMCFYGKNLSELKKVVYFDRQTTKKLNEKR